MKYALSIALFVIACGKGDKSAETTKGADKKVTNTDNLVASCMKNTKLRCAEYRGESVAIGTKELARLCEGVESTFSEGVPCPTENVIATCQLREAKEHYYQGYEKADEIEKICVDRSGTYAKP